MHAYNMHTHTHTHTHTHDQIYYLYVVVRNFEKDIVCFTNFSWSLSIKTSYSLFCSIRLLLSENDKHRNTWPWKIWFAEVDFLFSASPCSSLEWSLPCCAQNMSFFFTLFTHCSKRLLIPRHWTRFEAGSWYWWILQCLFSSTFDLHLLPRIFNARHRDNLDFFCFCERASTLCNCRRTRLAWRPLLLLARLLSSHKPRPLFLLFLILASCSSIAFSSRRQTETYETAIRAGGASGWQNMQSYTKYRSVTFFHEMSAKVFCDVCSTFIPSRKLLQQIILFEVSTGCGSGAY